jgi:hypothetical protein
MGEGEQEEGDGRDRDRSHKWLGELDNRRMKEITNMG